VLGNRFGGSASSNPQWVPESPPFPQFAQPKSAVFGLV
jgi:hypothetical protein